MKQMSLVNNGCDVSPKRSRKREFLNEMNRVVPWGELTMLIEPHYPKDKTGRPPFGIATLLRIHFLQRWFGLSDPAMEEALHDVPMYRQFAGLDAGITRLPDETTILRFRHLLERHHLAGPMLASINELLRSKQGLDAASRHGGRCDADRSTEFDQERRRRARSGDASDQKGQPVAFRHEGAHRGRSRIGPGSYRHRYGGQRQRCDPG